MYFINLNLLEIFISGLNLNLLEIFISGLNPPMRQQFYENDHYSCNFCIYSCSLLCCNFSDLIDYYHVYSTVLHKNNHLSVSVHCKDCKSVGDTNECTNTTLCKTEQVIQPVHIV